MANEFDFRLFLISLLRKSKTALLFLLIGFISFGGFRFIYMSISMQSLAADDEPETAESPEDTWQDLWITRRIFYLKPSATAPTDTQAMPRDVSREALLAYEVLGATTDALADYNEMAQESLTAQDFMDRVFIASMPATWQVAIYTISADRISSELLGKAVFDDLNKKITEQIGRHEISAPLISTSQGESVELYHLLRTSDPRASWIVFFINKLMPELEACKEPASDPEPTMDKGMFTVVNIVSSSIKYAVLGAVICAVLSMILLLLFDTVSIKVESAHELRSKTGLHLLGTVSSRSGVHV